jgi:hypothetical protein
MAAIAIAGVGLMVVCSSSLAAVMMMGGEEETPATTTPAGPSAGPSAPTTTTFHDSEIPNDALVIEPGHLTMGAEYNSPKDSTATTRKYYLSLQGDGNLVWVKTGGGTQWHLGSHVTMPGTTVSLQSDGNLCAYGSDINRARCGLTHDPNVPPGQHKIVGTKEGLLYVDHGTGVAGRSVIFTPPSTTETYVLPY